MRIPLKSTLAALIALGATTSPALAQTIVVADPHSLASASTFQAAVDASRVPTPSGTVTVLSTDSTSSSADCGGWAFSCVTDAHPRRIVVDFGNSGDYSPDVNGTFMHELGHVFDNVTMTPRFRRQFERIMRMPHPRTEQTQGWYWNLKAAPPWELFAEAYSTCATGILSNQGYDYHPTQRQLARSCTLIRNTALAPKGISPS